ncbi:hypothetical protein [Streptomyces altiplanensis]
MFAHARDEGIELWLDATEVQVRRPVAGHRGHTLWTDALRPGRMHDATIARTEGTGVCFQDFPNVEVLPGNGCPGRAILPPGKANEIRPPEVRESVGGPTTLTHPDASPSNTPSPTANTGSSSFAGPANG